VVLTLFTALLVAVIAFQVYRGVVAFRNPERPIERPKRTPALVWWFGILLLFALLVGGAFVGARIFGP